MEKLCNEHFVSYSADNSQDHWRFENHILELGKIYSAVENEKIDFDTLSNTSCITEIAKALDSQKDELSSWSETSKLWLNYQRMIKVAIKLIKADQTGSWKLHLERAQVDLHGEVAWQNIKKLVGQCVLRYHQHTIMQCRILQTLCSTRSEQHKEAMSSKLATKLKKHSPFLVGKALGNIITGINADSDVNVQDLFSTGKETVTQVEGQAIFSYTHKQKAKDTCSILHYQDHLGPNHWPALLFQRFLVISQSGELGLDEVLHYELLSHPPSLFEAKNILLTPDKAQLLQAIREYMFSSKAPV